MKFRNTIVGVAVVAMGLSALAADEITEVSSKSDKDMGIRVSLGVAPEITEVEFPGVTFNAEGDAGGQFEVLFVRRHWSKTNPDFAWIWGAGLFFSSSNGTDDDDLDPWEYDLATFGILGQGGVAYRIGNIVVLEAQPYLGVGGASLEAQDASGFEVLDGTASYFLFGIKAGAFVEITDNIELGVEVGYQGFNAETEVEDLIGFNYDLILSGNGLHAAGVIAFKF